VRAGHLAGRTLVGGRAAGRGRGRVRRVGAYTAVLRVRDDVIVMQTMMWPDEVRTPDFSVETGEVKAAEVKMANMLVETLAGDFDPSEFEDDYAGAVETLVKTNCMDNAKKTADEGTLQRMGGAVKSAMGEVGEKAKQVAGDTVEMAKEMGSAIRNAAPSRTDDAMGTSSATGGAERAEREGAKAAARQMDQSSSGQGSFQTSQSINVSGQKTYVPFGGKGMAGEYVDASTAAEVDPYKKAAAVKSSMSDRSERERQRQKEGGLAGIAIDNSTPPENFSQEDAPAPKGVVSGV